MKTVLRLVCLFLAIGTQIVWGIPGIIYGIMICTGYGNPHWSVIFAIPGLAFGTYAVLDSLHIEGPSWGVFQDEILAPTNWYLWHFRGYTIA